jgi:hypothetical protein
MADHPDPQPMRLEPWLDLAPHLDGLEVVSVSFGPDRAAYVLAVQPPVYHYNQRSRGSVPGRLNTFEVLRCDEHSIERIVLPDQAWNYHFVQPLPGDELLLVCARSAYRDPDDYDLNAQAFSRDGALQRSFCLGDGIASVQATGDGRIWTSYYDEGVFGNYGWNSPIGRSGLICWDAGGQHVYAYSAPAGLDMICDCYALNVASKNETWCYYYTEFPLVRLLDNQVVGWWDCPVGGAHSFAIDGDTLLISGGYRERDIYHVLELGANHAMSELATCAFCDADGEPLAGALTAFRADQIILLHENRCYRTVVAEALVRLT